MISLSLLMLAGAGAPPRAPEMVRSYIAAYASTATARSTATIPAWARKYNMACSGCHYPAPPRLNATGLRFRWAGYRMPEEIGEQVDVEKVQNYVSGGLEATYETEKTSGGPSSGSFALPAVAMFYAGPFGKHFAGFAELEFGPDNETERIGQVSALWGTKDGFGGFRAGQMHNFFEWGVAGFDRQAGIEAPTPVSGPLTSAVPFMIGEHAVGMEGFYVRGSNRLSAQVLNGITPAGEVGAFDSDVNKDVLVTDQFLLDDAGSGVQAMGYYGSIVGLDTATAPGLTSHFWRLGVSANKIWSNVQLIGALVYGKDTKLPAAAPDQKGMGYWVEADYTFTKKSNFTLYGRYEFLDPNTSTASDGNRRYLVGALLPVTVPQYLRAGLEYHLDQPQGGAPKTNAFAVQLLLFF
jgi:hypothetical protein